MLGIFVGLGVKFTWEVARLPGYGYRIVQLTTGTTSGYADVWLGLDDLLLLLVGLIVAAAGRRNAMMLMFGVGFTIGIILNKLFEIEHATVVPASFALPASTGKL